MFAPLATIHGRSRDGLHQVHGFLPSYQIAIGSLPCHDCVVWTLRRFRVPPEVSRPMTHDSELTTPSHPPRLPRSFADDDVFEERDGAGEALVDAHQ